MAVSPDAKTVAAREIQEEKGKYRGFVSLWSIETGRLRWRTELADVASLAYSPDGKSLAIGIGESVAELNLATGRATTALRTNLRRVETIAFVPDGQSLLVADYDSVSLLERRTGRSVWLRRTFPSNCEPQVFPDGKKVITAADSYGTHLSVRDARTGVTMREVTLPTELEKTTCFLSADGRLLATYGTSGKVNPWSTRVYDTATWQEIAGFSHDPDLSGNGFSVDDHVFSPDGRYLAMAGNLPKNASVEVRHARSLKLFRRIGTGQSNGIAFSGDGRFLVILIRDHRSLLAELWNVRRVLGGK